MTGDSDAPAAADPARLARTLGPLRRAMMRSVHAYAHLPDLPEAQVAVLRAVADGPLRPSELADALGLARPTVSNLLRTMERQRLIGRTPVGPGRAVEVAATPTATDLLARYDEASARLVADSLAAMEPEDVAALGAAAPALAALTAALEQLAVAPAEQPSARPTGPGTAR